MKNPVLLNVDDIRTALLRNVKLKSFEEKIEFKNVTFRYAFSLWGCCGERMFKK